MLLWAEFLDLIFGKKPLLLVISWLPWPESIRLDWFAPPISFEFDLFCWLSARVLLPCMPGCKLMFLFSTDF